MKQSSGKMTYPGRKQIFRRCDRGQLQEDRLGLSDESANDTDLEQPLMQLVFSQGKRLHAAETLEHIAERTAAAVAALPSETRYLDRPLAPAIVLSDPLKTLIEKTRR